jgi:N-acetylglucosaminyldiphosphoundecaprenol N-acetyl-beta-D-mannosaminyltransferase
MDANKKLRVVGVDISCTSYQDVADECGKWIRQNRSDRGEGRPLARARYICVTSVHGVISSLNAPAFRRAVNDADIATPDGMPVVWAMRSFGARTQQRVYGPTLMLKLCEQAASLGHKVFLYGARDETLHSLSQRLRDRFPGLTIAGVYSPPFRPLTPEEDAACIRMIQESDADLVFVGLSTPKQEAWMIGHRDKLPGAILIGVGAAFDFHAGRVKQAPAWMQDRGLEWFFRLCMEPGRLWKRYLLVTPIFLPLWALQKAGLVRFGDRRGETGVPVSPSS